MQHQISYFTYEGAPGQYFKCERYGSMSVARCGSNYESAPAAVKEGRLSGCIGCTIGAQHHGGALTTSTPRPANWCVRCRRDPAEYGGNGISKVRLVTGGVCVSCKNREYEVAKGANAKGVVPKKWSGLGPQFTGLLEGTGVVVARERMAKDRLEVSLIAMRRNVGAIAACWISAGFLPAPPAPAPRPLTTEQLVLFGVPVKSRPPLRAAPHRRATIEVEQFTLEFDAA